MRMDAPAATEMLRAVAAAVLARIDELTEADLAIGDGDHGIGMRRGFEAAEAALSPGGLAIDAAFRATGMALMSRTGGAAGAVFGTLFTSGAKAFAGADEITVEGFRSFLAEAKAAVERRGGVVEGQKTMLDALGHALRAAGGPVDPGGDPGGDLAAVTTAAARGAAEGLEATKQMVATTGKARSLGERSLGHPDPGAVSMSIILTAMRDFVTR